jgi:UDP-N-acetylglucosamine:LPS N-acetylglucosamine transferase
MKTTLYGNGKDRNEQGIPKVAKETNFVHPVYSTKIPIPIPTMREMCEAFKEAEGRFPTMLYVSGGSIGTKFVSFQIKDSIVGLDVVYNAPETKVA